MSRSPLNKPERCMNASEDLPCLEEIEDLTHIRDELQSFQTSDTFIGACLYHAQKNIEEAIAYLKEVDRERSRFSQEELHQVGAVREG